jgi:hypothetical protein
MENWSLSMLLDTLHDDIHQQLDNARKAFKHSVVKGDASENVWLELLTTYLPKRYQAAKAHVVDSQGNFSQQIDVVVFDRQYSPFILSYQGQTIIPAESVYAVFEAKQTINASYIGYAKEKIKSVRQLHRTSLPIPHAGGVYPPKKLMPIYGGILTFESDWNPGLGQSLLASLKTDDELERLNIGCVAAHGYFDFVPNTGDYEIVAGGKPATSFLFKLISELQFSGTVPMIDVLAYSKWLNNVSTVEE